MSYEISKICTCEIIDEKNPQRTVFRVIRVGKDGSYKNMDFETTLMIASESKIRQCMVAQWNLIHHIYS